MNKSSKFLSVKEYKIQASILLKALRAGDVGKALKRFKRLSLFSDLSVADLLQNEIKRKHALHLIAAENGFNSWFDLKIQVNFMVGGYLNSWFTNYVEAKSHLKSAGGFLLPYKNHFFICNADYIKQIGFDPSDVDWKLIGYDWVVPDSKKAWLRLYRKWSQTKVGRHE